jgi:hypothetical protein
MMLKLVHERDLSSQEVHHMNLKNNLYHCTFSFATLNLKNESRQLLTKHQRQAHQAVTKPTIVDVYASRNSYDDPEAEVEVRGEIVPRSLLNLRDFTAFFTIGNRTNADGSKRWCISRRTTEQIVRSYPTIPPNIPKLKEDYLKYKLMKYKPWIGDVSNTWADFLDENDHDDNAIVTAMQAAWIAFLDTEFAHKLVDRFVDELLISQRMLFEEDDVEIYAEERDVDMDDWMALCAACPQFGANEQFDGVNSPSVDWNESANDLPEGLLSQLPDWL